MPEFQIKTTFQPCGDQPRAIEELVHGIESGKQSQVLLGITGSGKTFTMANVIQRVQRPTLIIAHNKTLAAQLYQEFKVFFPNNAVEYFVSYYDYYQPEAYLPRTDTFIEKDMAINDKIDKMRLSATRSLLERNDVIIVASVSCIYGLGSPEYYRDMNLKLVSGSDRRRDDVLLHLVEMQYKRNDFDFCRATFRVRGDVLEIFPAYEEDLALRVEFFGDEIERLSEIDPLTGKVLRRIQEVTIYPKFWRLMPVHSCLLSRRREHRHCMIAAINPANAPRKKMLASTAPTATIPVERVPLSITTWLLPNCISMCLSLFYPIGLTLPS